MHFPTVISESHCKMLRLPVDERFHTIKRVRYFTKKPRTNYFDSIEQFEYSRKNANVYNAMCKETKQISLHRISKAHNRLLLLQVCVFLFVLTCFFLQLMLSKISDTISFVFNSTFKQLNNYSKFNSKLLCSKAH